MTILANKICNNYSIAPLTDNVYTSNFNEKVKLDNQIELKGGYYRHFRNPNRDDFNRRDRDYINLSQGLLTNLVIDSIGFQSSTSLVEIIDFRRKYSDELGRFRTNIAKLTASVSTDKPFETIKQDINDIYINEFIPAYNDCKKALKGAGIKWLAKNFMKVSAISASSTGIPMICGLGIPQALLVGAGISLVGSIVAYNVDKQAQLRENPYSYLLTINKKL